MSYLDRLYPGRKHGVTPRLVHEAVEVAEYAGASYAFGYVQNRYRERAQMFGVPADLLSGVALKGVALVSDLLGMDSGLMPHLNNFGNAGVAAYFHTLGAGKGAEQSGVKRLLIKESDVAKAKAALPGATILGVAQKAPKGDFLSSAELMEIARR